ncbi:hypothetical protein NZK32_17285 [Cyanobium sp. FGCU-52]|nr:hypothetical protein [Cyanobium sp. FGCU52]
MAHHAHPSDQARPALGPRQKALLTVLREADAELSGLELHERLKQASQRHGLATVYSNLPFLPAAQSSGPWLTS